MSVSSGQEHIHTKKLQKNVQSGHAGQVDRNYKLLLQILNFS